MPIARREDKDLDSEERGDRAASDYDPDEGGNRHSNRRRNEARVTAIKILIVLVWIGLFSGLSYAVVFGWL
ncbi:hypothetical protein K458DRAFT_413622 [Lentithecium fluviatile CBS 122367]|uniref:Uncharacterized protein n=1 Tax=Lentithecium fluviatile CBS 122367 TaxID=1168545 RepID=A0A6G1JFI0_9PLEO|nr:hypothetical protein K458DRAFT_413622 [Lentithecium fluviatile CBS 122367]